MEQPSKEYLTAHLEGPQILFLKFWVRLISISLLICSLL